MALPQSWFDRALATIAPRTQLKRVRAKVATELVLRHYEGAAVGRRTNGWNRTPGDANAVQSGATLSRLREVARDLVRNNPYAESAVSTICDHTVGWGISAKPAKQTSAPPPSRGTMNAWKAWAETTACDADGRHDFYGLQKLVLATIVQSGEVLVRRRMRRPEDGFAIPMQLQVLEPDHLDTLKTMSLATGGQIIQGVEFDPIGRRVAYWLYPMHPGSMQRPGSAILTPSLRVPATEVLHVYKAKRPSQVRGVTWFAPVVLRMKDFDEFEDATLMKQKIAACLAVITSDVDGTGAPLGTADDSSNPGIDSLEPGAILNVPAGRNVDVVRPPSVGDYTDYCHITLRAIATGLGVTYEDLTGDYTDLPFSAARMSRLRHWSRVHDWRWMLMIPQFCDPVYAWFAEVAAIAGVPVPDRVDWTAPPPPMIDPANEGLAYQRNIRTGIQTLFDAIRERGYDPQELLEEYAEGNKVLDALGLTLDSDPRKLTQAGQSQAALGGGASAKPTEGA